MLFRSTMSEAPANILHFDSDNSPYRGFQIHQWHDKSEAAPHDHPAEPPEVTGDGWISFVVRLSDGAKRGPYAFTGDAQQAMRKWAEEVPAEPMPIPEPGPIPSPVMPSETV